MRVPCWLIGHRREPEPRFVRRADGYPLAIYSVCRRCDKPLALTYGPVDSFPPFDAALAEKWSREFGPRS